MATLIPSLNSCIGRMQAGEKRFARRLETHLEDDYLCWYELPVGRRQRHSDFIILHPARGLLLLEVKDWKLDSIKEMDRVSVRLLTARGLVSTGNPMEQVRQCAYQLVNRLQSDPQLIHQHGRYQGKLLFPYGYGVVLSGITRAQFERSDMGEVLPAHQVICGDEMTDSVDPEELQQRFWSMFNFSFPGQLTLPQIDRVRWHVFPEIRIGSGQLEIFDRQPGADMDADSADATAEDLLPDICKVMDVRQEKLARSLGSGHRVIHGVAGSGKTLILGYRCLYLAKLAHKPILVICFNITLAARLRTMMLGKGINDRVHVYHFHDWCGEQLSRYHVAKPDRGKHYLDDLVPTVMAAVDRGRIPRGQYGALLIDEGHDFEEEWLRLVVQMVDPDEGSLLLLYDDAQSIYKKKSTMNFSLSSVGIQARGRTTILKLNYRNTSEILEFAYRFAGHYLSPKDSDEDHAPLIEPQSVGRHGPAPYLKICKSKQEEAGYIAHTLTRLHKDGVPWGDMCVACHSRRLAQQVADALEPGTIPVQCVVDAADKRAFDPTRDSVKVMTMHSSKGLEFPLVVIPDVGKMPRPSMEPSEEAKLLYVAMTRSTDKLLLTACNSSEFVELLLE